MPTSDSSLQTSDFGGGRATTNATAEAIIARLPHKPMLSPVDLACAIGHATTAGVAAAIDDGSLAAVRIGKSYTICRDEAIRFVRQHAN